MAHSFSNLCLYSHLANPLPNILDRRKPHLIETLWIANFWLFKAKWENEKKKGWGRKLASQTLFQPLVFDLFSIPNKFYTGSGIPFLSTNEKVVIPKQDEGKGIEEQKSTNWIISS